MLFKSDSSLPPKRRRNVAIADILFIIAIVLVLIFGSGCASVQPDRVSSGYSHTSHLRTGWPFGPSEEEATLDVADVQADWKRGAYTFSLSTGYMLRDGDFYGDPIIVHARFSRDLWSK